MIIDLPRILSAKVGYGTRNSGGSQSITGIGFKPSALIMMGVNSISTVELTIGYCDGISQSLVQLYSGGTKVNLNNTVIVSMYVDSLNNIKALFDSFDNDGFTLTWTKTGTVSISYNYLCLR